MSGLLALAFAAGMVAPVNPCGFALLPAWITQTLGETADAAVPARLIRALGAGAALTAGFVGTLMVAGLIVSAGARWLISAAPALGLAIGVLLVLAGLAMLTGRSLTLRLPSIPDRATEGPRAARMVVFGVGYAASSLSCTFGVLLAVIGQAQAAEGVTGLVMVFATYSAGSATVLLLLAVATGLAGTALNRKVRTLARYGPRITAAILVVTGLYLAWYWYPAATGAASGRTASLTPLSATASTWIQAHTTAIAIAAALTVVAVVVLVLRQRIINREGQTDVSHSVSD